MSTNQHIRVKGAISSVIAYDGETDVNKVSSSNADNLTIGLTDGRNIELSLDGRVCSMRHPHICTPKPQINVGTPDDSPTADTIYGAKAYAKQLLHNLLDEVIGDMEAYREFEDDNIRTLVDGINALRKKEETSGTSMIYTTSFSVEDILRNIEDDGVFDCSEHSALNEALTNGMLICVRHEDAGLCPALCSYDEDIEDIFLHIYYDGAFYKVRVNQVDAAAYVSKVEISGSSGLNPEWIKIYSFQLSDLSNWANDGQSHEVDTRDVTDAITANKLITLEDDLTGSGGLLLATHTAMYGTHDGDHYTELLFVSAQGIYHCEISNEVDMEVYLYPFASDSSNPSEGAVSAQANHTFCYTTLDGKSVPLSNVIFYGTDTSQLTVVDHRQESGVWVVELNGDLAAMGGLNNSNITSAMLPPSFQSIAFSCFYNCSSLKRVVLPSPTKVTRAFAAAFEGSAANLRIVVPSSLLEAYRNDSSWDIGGYSDTIFEVEESPILHAKMVRTLNGKPLLGVGGDVLQKTQVLSSTSYAGTTLEIGTGVTEVQTQVLEGAEFKLVGDSLTAGTTVDNEWVLRIYATTLISSVSFTPPTGSILWANGQAPLFVAGRRYELSFKRTYDGATLGVWCEFY